MKRPVDPDLEPLTADLGKRFEGAYTSIKPYPTCKCGQEAINATIDLVKENDIKAQDVEEVDVGVGSVVYWFVCEPKEIRFNPRNVVDCQFSLPYQVAAAIVKGNFGIEELSMPGRE